jgi:predicted nucleotidyltransferase
MTDVSDIRIDLPMDQIADFCRRWKIVEFALFGSVLREDFHPESDIDVLVTFAPEAKWSLFDHLHAQEELKDILRREVDLVDRKAVEENPNYFIRKAILKSAQIVYVA